MLTQRASSLDLTAYDSPYHSDRYSAGGGIFRGDRSSRFSHSESLGSGIGGQRYGISNDHDMNNVNRGTPAALRDMIRNRRRAQAEGLASGQEYHRSETLRQMLESGEGGSGGRASGRARGRFGDGRERDFSDLMFGSGGMGADDSMAQMEEMMYMEVREIKMLSPLVIRPVSVL